MSLFLPLRERLSHLLAEVLPARLAYWAAKRVLAHAVLTRYRDSSVADVRALEALDHWQASMLPVRVGKGLARMRVNHPTTPPIWSGNGEDVTVREAESVEVLEEVCVVSEVRKAAPVKP